MTVNFISEVYCDEESLNFSCKDIELFYSIYQLNFLIAEKSIDFITFSKKHEKLLGRADWLAKWNKKDKELINSKIMTTITSNNLSCEFANKLSDRINRAINYFDILELEENEFVKYQTIFNYLTQVLSQIENFINRSIKAENYIQIETFKVNYSVYTNSYKSASSYEDADFQCIAA
ncbi:hypothetical protein [Paraclostridium sordellii]|nr:hypothetical protein [Paeniclostridium sordellii]